MKAVTRRRLPVVSGQVAGDRFSEALRRNSAWPLVRGQTTTLQVNLGKLCNMACHHCHVEAGPKRTEIMSAEIAERVLELMARSPGIEVVDLTGGAPELNPSFRRLVTEARRLGRRVIDRCNLTVVFEPGLEDLPQFLARHEVHVVASLPCYQAENVAKQRGRGAFEKSILALRLLNAFGYGRPGSALKLDLVYNPLGASLPPPQDALEAKYKQELARQFGISFNQLLTITNMPIKRFAELLDRRGEHAAYMSLLANHFNPTTVPELMCRSLVSVGWDGQLYDCDFNQMLSLPLGARVPTVWDLDSFETIAGASIKTRDHCFGCTAGAGSSCSGSLR